MSPDELIDERVSLKQCRIAVDALHSYESKRQEKLQEEELITGKEPNVWLNITVKRIPPGHRMKPVKVPVVHPLVDPRTTPICLITKDPQREYKDLLETHNIKFISRVVGIEKLKGKFKPYEARRALLKENGMFLADERIVPLLPKLLGKKWFDAKKQPIPVCLKRKDLKAELERSISSTYMNQNQGTCTSVKIANLSHKPTQIIANLQKALPTIVANIKDGWENIQSLHIKTNSSVSLPIWSCSLDASEEGRWHDLEAGTSEHGDEDEESGESGPESTDAAKKAPGKSGKKRGSTSDDESEDAPRKRAKKESTSKSATKSSKSDPSKATATVSPKATKVEVQSDVAESVKKAKKSSSTAPSQKGKKKTAKEAEAPPSEVAVPVKSTEATKKAQLTAAVGVKDIKAKRDAQSGDKKKEKVIKQKLGKSAKNTLLGKKAAQG